jgi:hypothetical protein
LTQTIGAGLIRAFLRWATAFQDEKFELSDSFDAQKPEVKSLHCPSSSVGRARD